MGWEKRRVWKGQCREERAEVNGQLAAQVQGDVWACVMTECQVLIGELEQLKGPMLMSVAPVTAGEPVVWAAPWDHGDNLAQAAAENQDLYLWFCCGWGLCSCY